MSIKSQVTPQFSHAYACINGSTGIHHLLRLKGKGVAQVRSRIAMHIGEVTVHYYYIAVIRGRQRSIHVWQALGACQTQFP